MADRNERTIKSWVESSEYDLDTARGMLKLGKRIYVGFMCHLAVEKMLKACYVKLIGKTPPYSHKLGELAEEAGIYERLSPEQKNLLDELDPLNIEARYPKYKEKIHRDFPSKSVNISF